MSSIASGQGVPGRDPPGVSHQASSSYGYRPAVFGQYGTATNPTRPSPVASALAGPSPLTYAPPDAVVGNSQLQFGGQFGAPRAPVKQPSLPQQTGAPVNPRGIAQNTAPTPGVYDLNTDPILQQITALAGMGDEQAQAAALKQRQQLLTGYGDPGLATAVLGANDPTVQAAGQNPASTLAQLGTQHGRNLTSLEDALNKANLFYSGYRTNQLGQDAQDYQGQLAGAQGQVQGGFDTISGNLAAALGQNQQQRAQAAQDAYDRQLQAAMQSGFNDQLGSLQDQLAAALAGGGGGAAPGLDYTQTASNVGPLSPEQLANNPGMPAGVPVVDPGFYTWSGEPGPAPAPTPYSLINPPVQTVDPNLRRLALALASGTSGTRNFMA